MAAMNSFSDVGVVPVGHGGNELVRIGLLGRGHNLLVGGVGFGYLQILPDGRVEQVRILGDEGNRLTKFVKLELLQIMRVHVDGPLRGVPEAQQ
jgi:hypothetical protein